MCKKYIFIFLVCITALACRRIPNVQGKGEVFLQGIWQQDSIAHAEKLLSYTTHRLKFTCDSFYVDFTTHSKENYYEDSCFNNGIWKEYAKGTYQVKNDTLTLVGDFTKANYKQKVSGCYRTGRYINEFKIKNRSPQQLALEDLNTHNLLNLTLSEQITCVPKEL